MKKETIIELAYQLEIDTWPDGVRASKNTLGSRFDIFPQGFIFKKNKYKPLLEGSSTSMILQLESLEDIKSWEEVTTNGTIENHTPNGNTLYVVSVGASPCYKGHGVGEYLIQEQIKLAKKLTLNQVVLGSRVPHFHKFKGTIQQYVEKKNPSGYSIDPLIRFYQKNGFEIFKIKSDYMENDKESRNFGVLMICQLN